MSVITFTAISRTLNFSGLSWRIGAIIPTRSGVYSSSEDFWGNRPATVMRKRLIAIAAMICAVIFAGVSAGNFFPDQTWTAITFAQDMWAAIFLRHVPAPLPQLAVPAPYVDRDGYAVMTAWKRLWAKQHVIFVRREIKPDPIIPVGELDVSCLSAKFRKDYGTAMQDLASVWSEPYLLEDLFSHPEEFIIEEESRLPINDHREGVPANAAGYFAFSPVGFNADRSRAALYVLHRDGYYGTGEVFLLRRDNHGVWEFDGIGECGWIT